MCCLIIPTVPSHSTKQTLFQSSTMPVLSLYNTADSRYPSLPSGAASHVLHGTGAAGSAYHPYTGTGSSSAAAAAAAIATAQSNAAINNILNNVAAAAAERSLSERAAYSSLLGGLSGLSATNPLSGSLGHGLASSHRLGGAATADGYGTGYSTFTNPLLAAGGGVRRTTFDDLDLLTRSAYSGGLGRTGTTPNSPIPWDGYGLDGVNPTFMHTHLSRHGLDMEGEWRTSVFM